MRPNNVQCLSHTNASSGNGEAVPTQFVLYAAAQAISTGTPTGTVKFQASNDQGPVPSNWTDIANITVSISGSGSVLIPAFQVCYNYIRAVYTDGSSGMGTGTTVVNLQTQGY